MGKSHQAGWVVLRGKQWYGYFRRRVLDPITDEEGVDTVCIRLGLKTQLTKSGAREALRMEVTKQTGQNLGGRVLKDSAHDADASERSGRPVLAGQGQAGEIVSQVHLRRGHRAGIPDQRPYPQAEDSQESSAQGQAGSDLETTLVDSGESCQERPPPAHAGHDRSASPERVVRSALALLRRLQHVSITETVYRRQIRRFGKTPKSLGKVHLPVGLADELRQWKTEGKDASPDAFIFPNADGGFMDAANYRYRVLKPLAEELGIPRLNFQILRRTMATQAHGMGSIKDIQAHLRHTKADTTANEYMQELPESVQQMVGSVYLMLAKGGEDEKGSERLLPKATNAPEEPLVSY